MPKKTKKEKVLAMYHKKLRLLKNREVVSTSAQTKIQISAAPSHSSNKVKPVTIEPVNQYFYSDFKKSLLLITAILGLEVSLYFVKLIK